MVSSALTWWGGASRSLESSSMPAGKPSHTGYQYDSISRVAGQRELAPPSKFSKEGGFRNKVFSGIGSSSSLPLREQQTAKQRLAINLLAMKRLATGREQPVAHTERRRLL